MLSDSIFPENPRAHNPKAELTTPWAIAGLLVWGRVVT